jgi:hypothetical protein
MAGGVDFYAQEIPSSDSMGADGYIVTPDGNVYSAVSGPWSDTASGVARGTGGDVPDGKTYTYGKPEQKTNSAYHPKGAKSGPFFPIGTGPEGAGAIPDGRKYGKKQQHAKQRTDVGFHFNGNMQNGSYGCIAVYDNDALTSIGDPASNGTVTVHPYASDMDSVHQQIEQQVGHPVNWDAIDKKRPHLWPGEPAVHGDSIPTYNTWMKSVTDAHKNVRSGPKRRQTAKKTAELQGGVTVVAASQTVFIGPEQVGVARVNDPTSDGGVLKTGEGSILVG